MTANPLDLHCFSSGLPYIQDVTVLSWICLGDISLHKVCNARFYLSLAQSRMRYLVATTHFVQLIPNAFWSLPACALQWRPSKLSVFALPVYASNKPALFLPSSHCSPNSLAWLSCTQKVQVSRQNFMQGSWQWESSHRSVWLFLVISKQPHWLQQKINKYSGPTVQKFPKTRRAQTAMRMLHEVLYKLSQAMTGKTEWLLHEMETFAFCRPSVWPIPKWGSHTKSLRYLYSKTRCNKEWLLCKRHTPKS